MNKNHQNSVTLKNEDPNVVAQTGRGHGRGLTEAVDADPDEAVRHVRDAVGAGLRLPTELLDGGMVERHRVVEAIVDVDRAERAVHDRGRAGIPPDRRRAAAKTAVSDDKGAAAGVDRRGGEAAILEV